MRSRSHGIAASAVGKLVEAISICRSDIAVTIGSVANGWSIAPYDASTMLACFPHLRLREGIRLAAYHFREGGHNNGIVFAIPAERELPPPSGVDWESVPGPGEALKPEGIPVWADRQLGAYLEGDASALSFFEASVFQREAAELAATWRGRDWYTHTILPSGPLAPGDTAVPSPNRIPAAHWKPHERPPENWRPIVRGAEATQTVVEFYTHSALYRECIYRHRDTFREGYNFETVREVIAEGGGGFIY